MIEVYFIKLLMRNHIYISFDYIYSQMNLILFFSDNMLFNWHAIAKNILCFIRVYFCIVDAYAYSCLHDMLSNREKSTKAYIVVKR